MQFVAVSIAAGVLGTAVMTLFLWAVNKTGKVNADMVRALGSGVTRSIEKSLVPGLAIHFMAGIPFAMIYILAFHILRAGTIQGLVYTGLLFGFVHGFFFSFIMVVLAEHHPVERFQEAGFQTAIVHLVAHIFYGGMVGLIVGISGYMVPA